MPANGRYLAIAAHSSLPNVLADLVTQYDHWVALMNVIVTSPSHDMTIICACGQMRTECRLMIWDIRDHWPRMSEHSRLSFVVRDRTMAWANGLGSSLTYVVQDAVRRMGFDLEATSFALAGKK